MLPTAILLVLHHHRGELSATKLAERVGRQATPVDVDHALAALAGMGLVSSRRSPVSLGRVWRLADGARDRAVVAGLQSLGAAAAMGEV